VRQLKSFRGLGIRRFFPVGSVIQWLVNSISIRRNIQKLQTQFCCAPCD
jgi:hypothetical protein